MSLQVVLIVLGVAIIAAVYFLTALKRKRDQRHNYARQFSRLDVPDIILDHHEETFDEAAPAIVDPEANAAAPPPTPSTFSSSVGAGVILPPEDVALDDLPRVVNELEPEPEPSNERLTTDQMDLFGGDDATSGNSASTPASVPRTPPPAVDDTPLIRLFIRAHEGRSFGGPEIVRVLNAVGMQHGEMDIFHHFGTAELKVEESIFSAANLFEPGTFELGKIEAFRTSGLVLFLQLPAPLDGAVAFELLLNTAQRAAELLGGELYANPDSRLDTATIAALRQKAAQYTHGGH